ncbi:sulfite exporter TauE/SafE family protein [Planctomycetota bacterium]|nr:sulfite exporter TauE/SafE family protein [Planctomycetota bacterium]
MVNTQEIIWIAFVLMFGSLVNGAVGFGIGLICIPLLVLGGVTLPEAIAVMLVTMLFANGLSCYHYRKHLHWRSILPVLVFHLIALPLGVLTLFYLDELDEQLTKSVVGVFVLLAVGLQLFLQIKPRERLSSGWGCAAGLTSGYIESLVGMGSPPLILYMMAHKWDANRMRTFIWFIFLVDIAPMLFLLWYSFGNQIAYATVVGVLCFPMTMLGTRLGNGLGHTMGAVRLRRIAYSILIFLGFTSVAMPLMRYGTT